MKELEERIAKDAKVLPGDIVKVDGFLNHRVDCQLVASFADEFAKHFDASKIDIVVTAEASGIAIGALVAYKLGVPMVFAKKAKSGNLGDELYKANVHSYTYNKDVTLVLSKQWLNSSNHVLIIDDFLANGEAVRGLIELVRQSGATLEGIGIAIEKGFQHGGDKLREEGYDVYSLAIIDEINDLHVKFRD